MKPFYCAFLFVVVAVVDTDQKKFNAAIRLYESYISPNFELCTNESSVDPTLVDNMLVHGEFFENPHLKCFFKCLYKKLEIINDYGYIQAENMRKYTGTENKYINEWIYRYCQYNGEKDLCEKAFHMAKCTYQTVKIAYSDF